MSNIVRVSPDLAEKVRSAVIDWYSGFGRRFEWREETDPYRILVAEMLLRRTTASAVSRVYRSLVQRYPSPGMLASADVSELTTIVCSLGLQRVRVRDLLTTSKILVEKYGGSVPADYDALLALPGLGPYGASAVLNFAFGVPRPLVDGNVLHFLRRVFDIHFSGPHDTEAWAIMSDIGGLHDRRFYWGIIDLVATVCLRRNPRCARCPVQGHCFYASSSR
ncbi:MAG: hypothetical protein QXS20_10440 [Candidatus Thorarchaeota archaeon]